MDPLASTEEYLTEIKKELERLQCPHHLVVYHCLFAHYEGYPFPNPPYCTPQHELLKVLRITPTEPPEEGFETSLAVEFIRIRTFKFHAIGCPAAGPVLWNPLIQTYRDFAKQHDPFIETSEGFDSHPPYKYAFAWFIFQMAHSSIRA